MRDGLVLACGGRVAFPGCVDGVARVVTEVSDVSLLQQGEVLVMPMTHPGAVEAMLRAGAVVTDRGGMLCHAAVTCRELQVVCLVGTREATAVIRSGDHVRVCAVEGKLWRARS